MFRNKEMTIAASVEASAPASGDAPSSGGARVAPVVNDDEEKVFHAALHAARPRAYSTDFKTSGNAEELVLAGLPELPVAQEVTTLRNSPTDDLAALAEMTALAEEVYGGESPGLAPTLPGSTSAPLADGSSSPFRAAVAAATAAATAEEDEEDEDETVVSSSSSQRARLAALVRALAVWACRAAAWVALHVQRQATICNSVGV